MSEQILRPWSLPGVPASGRVDLVGFTYSDRMRIELQEIGVSKRRFYLDFPVIPMAFRVADEGKRLASLRLIPHEAGSSFFLVENSEFLDWFNKDSLDIYRDDPILHLAIITDDWLDILFHEGGSPVVVED